MTKRKVETININHKIVEFSVVGDGDPILVMHGGHSNCHEEFGYKSLLENGYSIITPSRAGYGKTSKEIGTNLTVAASYYVEILNHLKIAQVHVIAVSAGGPSGIRFASEYPDRVKTLTLQSAVAKEWLTPKDMTYKAAKVIFRPSVEKTTWKMLSFFNNRFPTFLFKQMISQFSSLPKKEILSKIGQDDIEEFRKMNGRQRSGHGFSIDLGQSKEITNEELQRITMPTLILHSKNDGFISLEHPQNAHMHIPNSKLSLLDSWGHLIWLGQDVETFMNTQLEFFKKNAI